MGKFAAFARIAEIEFADIVLSTQDLGLKLRIYLKGKSFIDFFYTTKVRPQRFSLHWERTHIDKTVYRLDNTPDRKWKGVKSFPVHFHNEEYSLVIAPPFMLKKTDKLEDIFRGFFGFVRKVLTALQSETNK